MRPRDICLKRDLIGFYEISREKATPEEIQELSGKEKADGARITQSEHLNDRWFLNAMSLVAGEER